MTTPPTLVLYHGSRRWEGPPSVQRGRKGRTEHGPGIYLTTSLARARRYGKVMRVTLAQPLTMLEDALASADDLRAYARTMRKRAVMVADVERSIARMGERLVPVSFLVNLAVNNDALAGDEAPRLARWLAARGIDASLATMSSPDGRDEDWLVVFNLAKIVRVEPEEVRRAASHLPLLRRPQGAS